MADFKLLIDTNVVIGLEDAHLVSSTFAELVRLSSEHNISLFIDGATYEDVSRDKDAARRAVTLTKLAKFQKLRDIPAPPASELASRFGAINSENDKTDVRLLISLQARAADFLVTQDNELHRRAERAGLASSVLTVEEALHWIRQTFEKQTVSLPYIIERKAYELPINDGIFASLRGDYPGFDEWFDKCRKQHRDCWSLEIGQKIAGLVIRKHETHAEAKTRNPGPKILKICTFKVRDEFRGEKFGELLLKQVLWFGQRNKYDVAYLTVFPRHVFLIDLLADFGFENTKTESNGELVFEKSFVKGALNSPPNNILGFDRHSYPRFYDGPPVDKFCVPIRPDYHARLFPEVAFGKELPLFPTERFVRVLKHGQERTPGNTIRKVYLCRARTTRLKAGDLLLFYMSKGSSYAASQSITTVGIVEKVMDVTTTAELIRLTAKRSVFSAEELEQMEATQESPVKMIDFLLAGHLETPIGLPALIETGVFSGSPPQSIARLSVSSYLRLRPNIRLGFEL